MLGLIESLEEAYDNLQREEAEESYGVPVFYDDETMYDHLYDE